MFSSSRSLDGPGTRLDSLHVMRIAKVVAVGPSRVIPANWQLSYQHPLYRLETFIDSERFRGACYRAPIGSWWARPPVAARTIRTTGSIGRGRKCEFIRWARLFPRRFAMPSGLPAGKGHAPNLTSLDAAHLAALLACQRWLLPGALFEQVSNLLGTLQWVMAVIQKKHSTIARAQRWSFGAATEKTGNIFQKRTWRARPPQRGPRVTVDWKPTSMWASCRWRTFAAHVLAGGPVGHFTGQKGNHFSIFAGLPPPAKHRCLRELLDRVGGFALNAQLGVRGAGANHIDRDSARRRFPLQRPGPGWRQRAKPPGHKGSVPAKEFMKNFKSP